MSFDIRKGFEKPQQQLSFPVAFHLEIGQHDSGMDEN